MTLVRCLDCAVLISSGSRCARCQRDHRRANGYGLGRAWQRLRIQAYERQQGRCALCAVVLNADAFDLDHVLPAARGGQATARNTRALCLECHVATTVPGAGAGRWGRHTGRRLRMRT